MCVRMLNGQRTGEWYRGLDDYSVRSTGNIYGWRKVGITMNHRESTWYEFYYQPSSSLATTYADHEHSGYIWKMAGSIEKG